MNPGAAMSEDYMLLRETRSINRTVSFCIPRVSIEGFQYLYIPLLKE